MSGLFEFSAQRCTMAVESGLMRLSVVAMVVLFGCTKPNPNVCCTDEADCMAKGIPVGSVCDQGLICRGNQCISEPCTSAASCDEAAPYCVAELCSETCAEDAHCPGFGQDQLDMFCVGGACVRCRDASDCPTSAPVCDAGACRGCNGDSDCTSGVCDKDESRCIDEASVLYVAANGSMTSDCSRADQCTLVRAFSLADANRTAVKLGTGTHSMAGTLLSGPKAVTIYGPGNLSADGGPQDGATLRVRDVMWTGSPGCLNTAPNLPKSKLELVRVDLAGNSINIEMCDAIIRDSSLRTSRVAGGYLGASGERAGLGGAMTDRGGAVIIERTMIEGGDPAITVGRFSTAEISNSVFKNQGSTAGWITTFESGTVKVRFSTFAKGALKCPVVAGNGFIESSNNIFWNQVAGAPTDTATGTYCSHSYDLVFPQSTSVAGAGNKSGVDAQFTAAPNGDFHLMSGSPAVDAADPSATEPFDFEGVTRPQGAGRDMGAFEYH